MLVLQTGSHYAFDNETAQFLCKEDGRYFCSHVHIVDDYIYFDSLSKRRTFNLRELQELHLILEGK